MRKGIWFGKLADGTEASVSDLMMQDLTVVQAARVRLLGGKHQPLDYNKTMLAAQYLRQRFPELNREEHASPYTEAHFTRKTLSEKDASNAVKVTIMALPEAANNEQKCQEEAMALMNQHVLRHPSSFSRLGWCLNVIHNASANGRRVDEEEKKEEVDGDGDGVVIWFIFSVSHTHVDGVAMKTILTDYLESYSTLLQGATHLPPRDRLPLYSSLPRDRVPLSWSQQVSQGFVGWLCSKLLNNPHAPGPKLLTDAAKEKAKQIQLERASVGADQRSGPLHVDFVELDPVDTKKLCAHARSVGLTVGSLVHGALFFALAKRYFAEHPNKDTLELEIPLSMDVRQYLQPALPSSVLAPQQGDVSVQLETTRYEVELALGSTKAMVPTLHKIALNSRTQVQAMIAKPSKLKPLEQNIFCASLYRNANPSELQSVQYVGDAWLSNVGLYKPSPQIRDTMKVETTFTLNPTIMPSYELVWCNSTLGGSMALSMVTDETMGRNKQSARDLLEETADALRVLVSC